ncbi:MAG: outer membrane beta-barrel protein [Bacteroidia bacterium]
MKEITLLCILSFILAFNIKAQENTEPVKDYKFSLGLNLSPDIAYRSLESESSVNWIKSLMDKSEDPKFGYTGGLNLQYKISQRFAFEGGVQYSNKGYAFKQTELTYGNMVDPRYEFEYQIVDGAPSKIKILNNFHYLDIPLRYILHAGKGKIQFIASAGLTTNILLKVTRTIIVEYEDGKVDRKTETNNHTNYKKIILSPAVSAGINYKISERFNISAEPTFRYGVMKIIDVPITSYLWSGGLNFTFYYSL